MKWTDTACANKISFKNSDYRTDFFYLNIILYRGTLITNCGINAVILNGNLRRGISFIASLQFLSNGLRIRAAS